jgi:anti-sigma B factor antagonist
MALKITPTQKNTHTVSIALSGQLNSETASVLDQQIQKALVNGANVIVLDMADLKMITSAGVGVVMKTQTSMAKRGGEMIMLNMQPQITKVFEIVRLLPTLTVFESMQEMDNYLMKIQKRIQEDGSFDSGQ